MATDRLRLLRNKRRIVFNTTFQERSFELILNQPTIGEIDDVLEEDGVNEYYNGLWLLCSCAYDMPSVLYDKMKRDYRKVSDWEFFRMIAPTVSPDILAMTLLEADGSGFSFYGFKEYVRTLDGVEDIVLYRPQIEDEETGEVYSEFVFDENLYKAIVPYLRLIVGFTHKFKPKADAGTAKTIVMLDRKDREIAARKKGDDSSMFDMIMSCINTEECSYDYDSIWNLTIFQLFKSFQQIQGKKSAMALLQGSCSGFVDTSKIPKEDMSWTYSDEKYKPKQKKMINDKTKK